MARACRTSASSLAARACSPPDHPARLKVENVTRQVSWLAPYRPGPVERRLPAPGRSGCVDPVRCLQLRGQPWLGPRSHLSSGQRRRTSKRQGYAVVGGRSTVARQCLQAGSSESPPTCPSGPTYQERDLALLPPGLPEERRAATCGLTPRRPHALLAPCVQVPRQGVKREIGIQADAAPATVSERSVLTTVPRRMAWEGDAFQEPCSSS